MSQLHTPEAQDNVSLQSPRLFANVEPITDNIPKAMVTIWRIVEWCVEKITNKNRRRDDHGQESNHDIRGFEDIFLGAIIGIMAISRRTKDAVKKLWIGWKPSQKIDPNNIHCVIDDIFD